MSAKNDVLSSRFTTLPGVRANGSSKAHSATCRTNGAARVAYELFERRLADVSERKRVERLQLFLDNIGDHAVIMTDPRGRVLEWLGGAREITGWREEDVLGGPVAILYTSEERAACAPEQDLLRAAEDGQVRVERWLEARNGTRFFAEGVLTRLRSASGDLRGFCLLLRDGTDRELAAAALRKADRRKDEFLALLAHELRNPLAPLRNGLQVMRLAADDAAAVERARCMMERQLGHMVRIIDDLLDISRISQDKLELRRERVLVETIVASAVETVRPVIEEAGHELTVSLPPDPVPVHADLTRLAQVVSNLLTNSARYTERGGRIRLSVVRDGRTVAVSVQDTGIGIPAEAMPRLFDLFSQVDRNRSRSAGGLGIGLALVKSLTEMHGGTVEAASDGPGQGSTFTLKLPETMAADEPAQELAPEAPRAGSGRRILVVDDDPDSAFTLAEVLRLGGNEVRIAHDGPRALEAAGEFRPKVILMDVGLPGLDGYETTRRIRELPWGKAVTIIALTGWSQPLDRQQSQAAGCDGHLVKPVDFADLDRLIGEFEIR